MANTEIKSGADNAQKIRDTRDLKIEQAVELALEDGVFSREELKALRERFHDDRFNIDHNNFREQKNLAESFKSERLLLKAKIDQTNDSDLKGRAQDRFAPNLQSSDLPDTRASSDTLPQGFSLHRGAKKDDPKNFNFFGTDEEGKEPTEGTGSNITGMKQEKVFNKGKSSAALDFKYSTLDGILAEGVFGTVFGSESNKSIVLDVTMGSELAQFLMTLGYKIDRDQRVKVTGEHFRKTADYLFTSGKVTETISQNSLGATYQLKLHDKREILDYFEANGYITQSQGKELADKDFTIDTATLFELYRNKRNIAGGTKTGASLALGLTPWENGKFKITLGAENLKFNTIYSGDKYDKQGMTAKAEYSHDITKDLMAKISAATSTTEKCVLALELAFKLKPNLQLVLRGEHIERYSSFGLADTSEERGSIALRGTFATPEDQKKIDESDRSWKAGAGKRNADKARETFRQMPQQAKDDFLEWSLSPAYKSTSVIAAVDEDTGRLIILDKLLLPNAVIDAQGNITEALPGNPEIASTGISNITLNGEGRTESLRNSFGLSGKAIVIYTGTLREPAAGTTDTYQVTIDEVGGGQTKATIKVQHGSVKVTSITFDRIPAPNQLPPTMGDVPNQSATVGTPITAINLASYVTLTNGDPIISYAIASGALPPGLTFNTTTGAITGTPTVAGTYNITVTATDNDGASNADAIQFVIAPALDLTAPLTTAAPSVTGTTDTATTLHATINENGTGYYLVLPAAAAAPTVAAVKAGTSFAMVANTQANQAISGLTASTAYKIYFVAKDTANNDQLAVSSVAVTTEAAPAIDTAPTVGAPTVAKTDTTVTVTNHITDADGVQNITYSIYSDAATTILVNSNVNGAAFAGLTASTNYWVKTTAETRNGDTGAWTLQTSPTLQVTTDAPANVPPTANNFTYGANINNTAKTFDWKVLSAAADVNGDTLTATVQVQGTKGVFAITGDNITYTPAAGQVGSDVATIRISDGQGHTIDRTVTVNGIDTNLVPTITGLPIWGAGVASSSTTVGQSVTFGDETAWGAGSTASISANNGASIANIAPNTTSYGVKTFDFIAPVGFPAGSGPKTITITYTVTDANGVQTQTQQTVDVAEAPNVNPVAVDFTVDPGIPVGSKTIDISGYVSDAEDADAALQLIVVNNPDSFTVDTSAWPMVTFTAPGGWGGPSSITYKVRDTLGGDSGVQTITLNNFSA